MTNAARFGAERFGLAPGDVYVNNMPLFHVGGQEVAFGICQAQATDVSVVAFDPGVVVARAGRANKRGGHAERRQNLVSFVGKQRMRTYVARSAGYRPALSMAARMAANRSSAATRISGWVNT